MLRLAPILARALLSSGLLVSLNLARVQAKALPAASPTASPSAEPTRDLPSSASEATASSSPALQTAQAELETLREQFCVYLLRERLSETAKTSAGKGSAASARSLHYAQEQSADGSWKDLHYDDQSRSNWGPYDHVLRMLGLALALPDPALRPDERERLLNSAARAGAFWRAHTFVCPNWWYNEIGAPMSFGEYALLMGRDLPKEDFAYITGSLLARCDVRMTGQNKVWLSGNLLMRGLLLKDSAMVSRASAAIWSEVGMATGEGVQADWSFHQHGPQQQFGNYGLGYAEQVSRWLVILRGSSYALPEARLQVFRNYLLQGLGWVCWRGEMDISACGRQLTPHSPESKVRTLLQVFSCMELADPSHAKDYAELSQAAAPTGSAGKTATRQTLPPRELVGSRFFWRSDYGVHRQTDFFASLKMHSARVIGGEVVNSENLAGRYLADGALFVHTRGGEYADIFPCWDWRHIPGVTQLWDTRLPKTGPAEDRQKTTLVGGFDDESGMLAMMDYDRDGVQAHKAWFMHGHRVLALGAGIHSSLTGPLHTTINQCLLRGPVQVEGSLAAARSPSEGASVNDSATHPLPALGNGSLGSGLSLVHDGLRYEILDGEAHWQSAQRTGTWSLVYRNPGTPKEEQTRDLFCLWLDHGKAAQEATYAYAISSASAAGEAKPELLSNSAALQALRWTPDLIMIAFWAAGDCSLDASTRLTAKQACLVRAQRKAGIWELRVADPSQKRPSVELLLNGRALHGALPTGALAGSSVLLPLD